MKKRTKKFSIIAAIAIVVIVVAAISFTGSDSEATSVQAELAVTGEISEIVTASGTFTARRRGPIA